jgi:chromosome segregation ATPase
MMSTKLSATQAEIDSLRFCLREYIDAMDYMNAKNARLRTELAAAQAEIERLQAELQSNERELPL